MAESDSSYFIDFRPPLTAEELDRIKFGESVNSKIQRDHKSTTVIMDRSDIATQLQRRNGEAAVDGHARLGEYAMYLTTRVKVSAVDLTVHSIDDLRFRDILESTAGSFEEVRNGTNREPVEITTARGMISVTAEVVDSVESDLYSRWNARFPGVFSNRNV